MEDREYKLPAYTEEEIIEMLAYSKLMGLRFLQSKLSSFLGDSLTEEVKSEISKFINDESEKTRMCFEDSTLTEKNRTRIKYSKDPINMLKKAKLDGVLDCYDSGLFE